MKILFISQIFPAKKGIRNTSSALREFVEEWGKKGHQIKVIRPHFSYESEPFPSNPYFHIGKKVTIKFIKPFRIPLLKLSFFNDKKIIRELPFNPDVIICHLYNSYFLFSKLSKKLEIPLVLGIHMSDIRISKNKFHRWHQKRVFQNAIGFACRSHQIQRLFSQQFPQYKNKTFLALSGIPTKYFKTNTKKHNISKKIKLITVSSLIKRKQIEKVIQTLATDEIINKNW
jgi:glycosyltransferase involved in cell wall biosynthesis